MKVLAFVFTVSLSFDFCVRTEAVVPEETCGVDFGVVRGAEDVLGFGKGGGVELEGGG